MSNDEEKEEEEVRREHTRLTWRKRTQWSLFLSAGWYFFYIFARFDAPVARFWTFLARETVAYEREAGVRRRAEFRAFSHFGVVFPVSDDANRDVF